MNTVLIIVLIILLLGGVGAGPWWGHSANWGYGPSGVIFIILIMVLIFAVTRDGF